MLEAKNDEIVQLQSKVPILKEQLHDSKGESKKQKKHPKRKLKEGYNSKNTQEKEK